MIVDMYELQPHREEALKLKKSSSKKSIEVNVQSRRLLSSKRDAPKRGTSGITRKSPLRPLELDMEVRGRKAREIMLMQN